MKKIVLLAALAIAGFAANAQKESKKFTLAAGPVVSFPAGDLSSITTFGIGGEIEGSLSLSESFEGFAQVGYTSFAGKSYDVGMGIGSIKLPSTTVVPVLVGGRYVTNGISFGAGLGYASYSNDLKGGFTYSPQIGYDFGKIKGIVNYTATSVEGGNLSFLGVKVFYKF
jgi:hypothetical protein